MDRHPGPVQSIVRLLYFSSKLLPFSLHKSINANAEKLRHKFVAHEGKKELRITSVGTRYTADFGSMSRQMADLLHENVST